MDSKKFDPNDAVVCIDFSAALELKPCTVYHIAETAFFECTHWVRLRELNNGGHPTGMYLARRFKNISDFED